LLQLFIAILVVAVYMKTIVPFLSPTQPASAKLLVVEGYLPDYAVEEAMKIYRDGNYEHMVITGKKREKGAHLDVYTNDGEYSAATLMKLGFNAENLTVVELDEDITKDRTYQSARAVRPWLEQNRPGEPSVDLVSLGTHARRSRLLFDKAFEGSVTVGIYAIPNQAFDPDRWWRTSHGFREVNKETIAWIYARFFFFP
jgi:uncharacterized SAM-binding protein YcdF (DUF218 family)